MSTPIEIPVGTVIKAVKYESGEPDIVEVKFLGKPTPRVAGYLVQYMERQFCAGYEMVEGAFMLSFTF
jgi:hypothetical protein